MKRILFLTFILLLTLVFGACGEQTTQFSVTMEERSAMHDPVILTVTLPNHAKESEITFDIDGTVYTVTSLPPVKDPTFVFADDANDGMQSVSLVLASDVTGEAVLSMHPDDGTDTDIVALCFVADMEAFSTLTDYLRTN